MADQIDNGYINSLARERCSKFMDAIANADLPHGIDHMEIVVTYDEGMQIAVEVHLRHHGEAKRPLGQRIKQALQSLRG